MIWIRTLVALGALGGVVAARSAETGAPLSETQRELRRLQTDRKNRDTPTVADGLKSEAPVLHFPVDAGAATQRPTPEKQERERQLRKEKAAEKNWLIEGMAKLEREEVKASGSDISGRTPADGEEAKIDTSDPAYLLKLFDDQKKAEKSRDGDRAVRPAQPNAFAPFLQGWMAPSPVKDQLLGSLDRQGIGGTVAAGVTFGSGSPAGTSQAVGGNHADSLANPRSSSPSPNPYLAESGNALGGQPAASLPLLPATSATPPALPPADISPRSSPAFLPVPEPAPADRKILPPPAADDKKYFPQLKKF
jgi:hypothetical protein